MTFDDKVITGGSHAPTNHTLDRDRSIAPPPSICKPTSSSRTTSSRLRPPSSGRSCWPPPPASPRCPPPAGCSATPPPARPPARRCWPRSPTTPSCTAAQPALPGTCPGAAPPPAAGGHRPDADPLPRQADARPVGGVPQPGQGRHQPLPRLRHRVRQLPGPAFTLALTCVARARGWRPSSRGCCGGGRLGIRSRLLLLDRGFWSVAVVRYLQAAASRS